MQILGSLTVLVLGLWGAVRVSGYVRLFRTRHHIRWRLVALLNQLLLSLLAAVSWLNALVVPTNILLGLGFLAHAWSNASRSLPLLSGLPRRRGQALLLVVAAVVSMLFGIVALSTADRLLAFFVLQAGAYCVVTGMVGLLLLARDASARPARPSP